MKLDNQLMNKSHFLIFSDLSKIKNLERMKKTEIEIINFVKILKKNNKNIILPTYNMFFPENKKTNFSNDNITTGYINKILIKKFKFKEHLSLCITILLLVQIKKIYLIVNNQLPGRDSD